MVETTARFGLYKGKPKFFGGKIGFNERGTFIVDAFTTTKVDGLQGSYFTTLPISPSEYRQKYPTGARYKLAEDALHIWDDWGSRHSVFGPRELLEAIAKECADAKLPQDVSPL